MKYYKYFSQNKNKPQEDFWVCERCRKSNSNLILEGKWRLIDRQESDYLKCSQCKSGGDEKNSGV